jgi:hypothetical protein
MRRSTLSGRRWLAPLAMTVAIGFAACTTPAGASAPPVASPKPSGMMEASPTPEASGMMEASPSPAGSGMMEASPSPAGSGMMEASPSPSTP